MVRVKTKANEIELEELSTNDEIDSDIAIKEEEIVVYSRDWTISTIIDQIVQDNIDLNPKFQRRNAWDDKKKSRLIESFILGLPVPGIVLAENLKKPKSYIIIDGKQRLLTISGFLKPDKYDTWDKSVLSNLRDRTDLNGKSFEDLHEIPGATRGIENADMRCTIISNYKETDVLYDIFYRLNTGSVSLSTQELRQVLNKGDFADYLMDVTKKIMPVQVALGLEEPDPRLYDIEFIVRYIAFDLFGKEYRSNLKKFLDEKMGIISREWVIYKERVVSIIKKMNDTIGILNDVFGESNVGKRYYENGYSHQINRVLLETMIYYFSKIPKSKRNDRNNKIFIKYFQQASKNNIEFNESIAGSTKDVGKYRVRQNTIRSLCNRAYNAGLHEMMVREVDE